ncbi:putative protein phosphatase 2C 38 [Capsicum annuum]|uniref:PPM-type phosphatase domain-containing protein n=1 Tax=Capsicum annuum TaxID=4072 RepID=A0A2G2ZKT3_CAPAN|nr:putative protein phosphatase 2C 38 [Capsicum annuum]
MSADDIRKAYLATEEEFLSLENGRALKEVKAVQLSSEHNASLESVREELRSLHPDDPNVVVLKHKVWRVKGVIQVSRSIGDAYLKRAEFNREPLLPKFRFPGTFEKPILLAEPSIIVQKLVPEDQFLIFASDGLWEHLSNQEAVDIVSSCEHHVRLSSFLFDKEESPWLSNLILFLVVISFSFVNKSEREMAFIVSEYLVNY